MRDPISKEEFSKWPEEVKGYIQEWLDGSPDYCPFDVDYLDPSTPEDWCHKYCYKIFPEAEGNRWICPCNGLGVRKVVARVRELLYDKP